MNKKQKKMARRIGSGLVLFVLGLILKNKTAPQQAAATTEGEQL